MPSCPVVVRLKTLKAHETMDRTKIEAGEGVERYLVASFRRSQAELPLHATLSTEWFRATGRVVSSIGSGGPLLNWKSLRTKDIRIR